MGLFFFKKRIRLVNRHSQTSNTLSNYNKNIKVVRSEEWMLIGAEKNVQGSCHLWCMINLASQTNERALFNKKS